MKAGARLTEIVKSSAVLKQEQRVAARKFDGRITPPVKVQKGWEGANKWWAEHGKDSKAAEGAVSSEEHKAAAKFHTTAASGHANAAVDADNEHLMNSHMQASDMHTAAAKAHMEAATNGSPSSMREANISSQDANFGSKGLASAENSSNFKRKMLETGASAGDKEAAFHSALADKKWAEYQKSKDAGGSEEDWGQALHDHGTHRAAAKAYAEAKAAYDAGDKDTAVKKVAEGDAHAKMILGAGESKFQ
jgi:hypothetical protein